MIGGAAVSLSTPLLEVAVSVAGKCGVGEGLVTGVMWSGGQFLSVVLGAVFDATRIDGKYTVAIWIMSALPLTALIPLVLYPKN